LKLFSAGTRTLLSLGIASGESVFMEGISSLEDSIVSIFEPVCRLVSLLLVGHFVLGPATHLLFLFPKEWKYVLFVPVLLIGGACPRRESLKSNNQVFFRVRAGIVESEASLESIPVLFLFPLVIVFLKGLVH